MVRPLLLLLLLPGCIATQARVHVGPTIDSAGKVGVHGGLTAGFGYATSDHSGLLISPGVVSGSDSHLAVSSVIEGARLGEDDHEYGFRAGMRSDLGLIGDRSFLGATGAVLYPLRRRSSYGGHEKSFQTSDHSALLVGLETQVGAVIIDDLGESTDEAELRLGGGLALTLEWIGFSRMH